jgi:hypothetical protein
VTQLSKHLFDPAFTTENAFFAGNYRCLSHFIRRQKQGSQIVISIDCAAKVFTQGQLYGRGDIVANAAQQRSFTAVMIIAAGGHIPLQTEK